MSILSELKTFALRGNLVDMAIGFTVGAAFTAIAKSLVNDVIMPPVGLLMGGADFADFFVVLKEGAKAAGPYETLAGAQQAGAITVNYGVFINSCISFLLVTLVMFLIIKFINRAEAALDEHFVEEKPQDDEPKEKKCPECRMVIPYRASRCGFCTSKLELATETGSV